MQKIADAFEELQTDGLKVTKTINEVVNWVVADREQREIEERESGEVVQDQMQQDLVDE